MSLEQYRPSKEDSLMKMQSEHRVRTEDQESPFFSIILPIYHVEKYLRNCIKSIQDQTFQDYEVILVDDESPDQCPAICDEIVQKDKRFSVIHKKNAGAGLARNSGLDAAKGAYIVFVDPDDYLDAHALQGFYEQLQQEKFDVCYGGVYNVLGDATDKERFWYEERQYRGDEIRKDLLMRMVGKSAREKSHPIPMSVWRGIYKASLLEKNQIRFLSERVVLSEDYLFTFDVLANADTVSCINHYFYYHTKDNAESLSTKYNPNRFNVDRSYSLYGHFIEKATKIGYEPCYKQRMQAAFLSNIIVCIKQAVGHKPYVGMRETILTLKRIASDDRVQDVLATYPYSQEAFGRRSMLYFLKKKNGIMIYTVTVMGDFIKKKKVKRNVKD